MMLLTTMCATASWSAAATQGTDADANQLLNEQFGPFKLSVGENDAGGVGANLNGEGRYDFGVKLKGDEQEGTANKFWFYPFPNLLYSATGTWSSKDHSTNNASLSLKPGFDSVLNYGRFYDALNDKKNGFKFPITTSPDGQHKIDANGKEVPVAEYPASWLGFGFYGDAELRYGSIKQGSSVVTGREFLVGGQFYSVLLAPRPSDVGPVHLLASPHWSVGYYHPSSATATSDLPLPPGFKANYVQSELETVLGFGPSGKDYVKLDFKYDASKANSGSDRAWQNLVTVKLWIPGLKFNGVNPSVTYQSGKNGGFTYDRQVLIGVLVEFLDPKKK